MITLEPAQISFNSLGIPYSEQFKDTYYSLSGAIDECEHVFIEGNDLKRRWANTQTFTIAELGFGFGLNFFVSANYWQKYSNKQSWLHYISFEKHPVKKQDLIRFYEQIDFHSDLIEKFSKYYPLPFKGQHRIEFSEQNISLTLVFNDALLALKDSSFIADAWYLDGFAPRLNNSMWSTEIMHQIARLTNHQGTFATYSCASAIQNNLNHAGFQIKKKAGFAKKREMLTGSKGLESIQSGYTLKQKSWLLSNKKIFKPRKAIVVGAGLAGVMISAALAKRGWQISLIEQHSNVANEGSGNANAILMPRLSVDHDLQAQLTLLGFLYSTQLLSNLNQTSNNTVWHQCGAIQIPRDAEQWQRMQQITRQENISIEFLQEINSNEASKLANCKLKHPGWLFPQAGWAIPKNICSILLEKYSSQIKFINTTRIDNIEFHNQNWHISSKDKTDIEHAPVIILTNALNANQYEQTRWCPLNAKRGQLTYIGNETINLNLQKIICSDIYISPSINNNYILGATFVSGDTSIEIRSNEHQENITKLNKLAPDLFIKKNTQLDGRAAIRAVSPDRLPIVGPVAQEKDFYHDFHNAALGSTKSTYPIPKYHQGLYLATGFGSRGIAWIPICTEALASLICCEPNLLNQQLLNAIHPNRFLMKQLIKSVQ